LPTTHDTYAEAGQGKGRELFVGLFMLSVVIVWGRQTCVAYGLWGSGHLHLWPQLYDLLNVSPTYCYAGNRANTVDETEIIINL
jgi:hypothetical protein